MSLNVFLNVVNESEKMKKKLLAVSFSLVLTTPSLAATSLIPQWILKHHSQPKTLVKNKTAFSDEYVDFSGHWVGTCDQDPDEPVELNIELAEDYSSIKIDNINYSIDAISTQGVHGVEQQENINHMRWRPDGQALLITLASFYKEGNLTQDGLETIIGNMQLFMNNKQLNSSYELTFFRDGVLGETLKVHCVYTNQNK